MLAEPLRRMYEYSCWATKQVIEAADGLTSEQLLAPGQAGHGSIRETLVHLMGTHRGWLSWWDGSLSAMDAYNSRLDEADYPDVAALRQAWAEIEQQTLVFVSRMTDDDVSSPLGFDLPNGQRWEQPLWGLMLHVANHGTQHRSEIASMLTEVGHSPGDLDFLFYLDGSAQARAS